MNRQKNISFACNFHLRSNNFSFFPNWYMHFNATSQGKTCFYSLWDETQTQNIWAKPFTCTLALNWNEIKPFLEANFNSYYLFHIMSKWNDLNFILKGFSKSTQKIY
jgi:hypothetical protein